MVPNLKDWGFNTVGWVQEVTVRNWRHSRSFTIEKLFDNPGCVGFHLCGAYQRNRARRYGLLDDQESADALQVSLMTAANQRIAQQVPGDL